MAEEWRPVMGSWYAASSQGRIKRIRGKDARAKVGHIMAPQLMLNGYLSVMITIPGFRGLVGIHRLVAEGFIGPCPEGIQVNHKDGNKKNNMPLNLEYVTPKQNAVHASTIGLLRRGEQINTAKLKKEDVDEIRKQRASGTRRDVLAVRYGVSEQTIYRIVKMESWKTSR